MILFNVKFEADEASTGCRHYLSELPGRPLNQCVEGGAKITGIIAD
jgi:hypothetical protein